MFYSDKKEQNFTYIQIWLIWVLPKWFYKIRIQTNNSVSISHAANLLVHQMKNTLRKLASSWLATARARRVLPVPGGPYSRQPLGGVIPTLWNSSGLINGSSITCNTKHNSFLNKFCGLQSAPEHLFMLSTTWIKRLKFPWKICYMLCESNNDVTFCIHRLIICNRDITGMKFLQAWKMARVCLIM